MKLKRFNQNLKIEYNKVYSYNTHVATIDFDKNELTEHKKYSITTSKHVNYVCREMQLKKIEEWKK